MKKYLKIALLVVVAAIFIFTFVFLYQKSKPKITVYGKNDCGNRKGRTEGRDSH